jgi:hypothetical protein
MELGEEVFTMIRTTFIRSLITAMSGLALATSLFISSQANAAAPVTFNTVRNCDNNAVVYCGAMSATELKTKYAENSSIGVIYNYFGITKADITSLGSTAVAGDVTKTGDVTVNGKEVAHNAVTVGRQDIGNSTHVVSDGVSFYTRTPSVSFLNSELPAFVVLNSKGQFEFAILPACGNAVKATNVVPAPAPKPVAPKPPVKPVAPKPTPVKPSPVTPTPVAPTPVAPTPATPTPIVTVAYVAPAPKSLVNTGPGSIMSLFTATSAIGAIGYRYFLKRRTI